MKGMLLPLLLVAVLLGAAAGEGWAQARDLSWGTSAVGSAGHRALVNLADLLNRKMPTYRITVLPTPGAVVTVKGYATGQFDGYYGADIAFYELANDINRFEGFQASIERQPVQSFWTFTVEVSTAIHSRDRDEIQTWGDLSGKRVFTGPRPWDVRAHLERAYSTLGVEHEYVEVDLSAAGSLLETGTIDAFISYTNAEATTAPWIIEASLAADRTARSLDPVVATSVVYTYFLMGDYASALAKGREEVSFMPAYAMTMLGREREGIAMRRELRDLRGPSVFLSASTRTMIAAIEMSTMFHTSCVRFSASSSSHGTITCTSLNPGWPISIRWRMRSAMGSTVPVCSAVT